MTDTQIIDLYWARSEEAILATADTYGGYCAAIAWNILHSREDTEECVNDTWHRAWQSMPPERPNPLRVGLGKITRNLALDRWRASRAGKRGGGQLEALLSELEGCLPAGDSPERQAEDKELAEAINTWLKSLPYAPRIIFLRRYWYGDSVADIAKAMGMVFGYEPPGRTSFLHHRPGGRRLHRRGRLPPPLPPFPTPVDEMGRPVRRLPAASRRAVADHTPLARCRWERQWSSAPLQRGQQRRRRS